MSTRNTLLSMLADGGFHSGTDLGKRLGISRAAVHKGVQHWIERGLDIHTVPGRGYRLGDPFVPLVADTIRVHLQQQGIELPIDVLPEVDSTNAYLLDSSNKTAEVCLAESQSAGRGRRGRVWVATPFRNIMLSMRWSFDAGPATLTGLSLAAGVAVLRALSDFGVRDAGLKWPNDILWDGRKLAGLLIDMRGEASGPAQVVLGLGLNVSLTPADGKRIDQTWSALRECLPAPIDRNRLAALLIGRLYEMFGEFARTGFASFRSEWERHHVYAGKNVRLQNGQEHFDAKVEGVEADGSLRVRVSTGELRRFHSGDISLRGRGQST